MRLPAPSVLDSVRDSGRRRRDQRRLERVAADPASATVADIVLLLEAEGAAPDRVASTLYRAASIGVQPAMLWEWVRAFDGLELVRLLCSESPDYLVLGALVDGITIHREFSAMLDD
ncbi:hypothetical protein [Nocardioides plantarum]|uniref:Uncharacterized protein n=1 Tax=Nocardioides plantarum TaxID=29299 RepID=A0ABV5K875_9ACTN|nr:hypothetical protein [Nocardioides plantarum]